MNTGNLPGAGFCGAGSLNDMIYGLNDSVFRCNTVPERTVFFETGCNCGMMDGMGIGTGGDIRPFMQMFGAMFGMACGYKGLDLLNFMNNWSQFCNNMGLNTMQGLTNAYQSMQTQNMGGMYSVNGIGNFGSVYGVQTGIYGPYLGATNAGSRLSQIALVTAYQENSCGKCLKGVNDTLQQAYGFRLSYPSAYMAKQSLDRMGDKFQNVTCQYQPASKLKSLPPGAIVVWDRNSSHPHGHISIALGNGQEASDHIQSQITGYGSSYVVYMPKDGAGSCPV